MANSTGAEDENRPIRTSAGCRHHRTAYRLFMAQNKA